MEELENVVKGFSGVEKAFAVQAGNEVRIIVDPGKIDDLAMMRLSRDITKKIGTERMRPLTLI